MNRAPFIPVKEVIFPSVITTIFIGRESSINSFESALLDENKIVLFLQKNINEDTPDIPSGINKTGVLATILQSTKLPDGIVRVLVEAESRVLFRDMESIEGVNFVDYEIIEELEKGDSNEMAIERKIIDSFEEYLRLSNKLSPELIASIRSIKSINKLINLISSNLNISIEKKQEILEIIDIEARSYKILHYISEEREVLDLEKRIDGKVREHMTTMQKNYYLKEKLRAIKEELGEDNLSEESESLIENIERANIPQFVEDRLMSEAKKLSKIPPYSSEFSVVRNYIENILELPWKVEQEDRIDISKANEILDEEHYGLEEVKKRILEFLAVKKLNKKSKSNILCLLGPSGVGKTSLARSIAKALGRKFSRIALGGVEDESEIRGHRRTYIGAMPGRIIKDLKHLGTKNPVILLDEIDKLSKGFRGDPASALLEVLDPEQNSFFMDNYVDMPFDISNVFFITTANYHTNIPNELKDRLEVVKIPGYDLHDKQNIATKYLIDKVKEESGLSEADISFTKEAIKSLILDYTKEAGVRELRREIARIFRSLAKSSLDSSLGRVSIGKKDLEKYLGPAKYDEESSKNSIFAEMDEIDALRASLEELELPEYVKNKVENEIRKLEKMHAYSSDYSVAYNHIETLLELPWLKSSRDKIDIVRAEKILNEDHYGLEKVKERILEFLAVKKLNKKVSGSIICLVGPPGVGKTSLAKSIAKALGRKFSRIALGGVRDESEIRGHRKTYVGAMPGRIVKELKNVGTNNPLLLLDEIDKISETFKSDPSSALLEVLDPAQNKTFTDNYLDIPFDLSKVFFLATANDVSSIPRALKDRLEIIYLSSYTNIEKKNIAERYLIDKSSRENGTSKIELNFVGDVILNIINQYTAEAGVRGLKRVFDKINRKIARKLMEDSIKKVEISSQNLKEYLGAPIFVKDKKKKREGKVGIVNGLAWTSIGGCLMEIQALLIENKGKLLATGKLGDVMKESTSVALSYVNSISDKVDIDKEKFGESYHLHLHFPEGATPKDGPSAGIAITTAIISAMSNKPVRQDVAMTGEVTITGEVLAIGGVKEKIIGARRAGIKDVILPYENKKDVEEVPKDILEGIKIHFATNYIKDVLEKVLF